jgi:hypothetical protein
MNMGRAADLCEMRYGRCYWMRHRMHLVHNALEAGPQQGRTRAILSGMEPRPAVAYLKERKLKAGNHG